MRRASTDAEYLDSGKIIVDADGIPLDLSHPIRIENSVGTRIMTGDLMIQGDTGRRNISALMDPRATGTAYIRRENSLVEFRIEATLSNWSSGDILIDLPAGFRLPFLTYMPPGYNNPPNVAMLAGRRMAVYSTTTIKLMWMWQWLTEDTWPTSLPGTPA